MLSCSYQASPGSGCNFPEPFVEHHLDCLNVVDREEEAIKLDGLSVAQMKELQEKAEKHHFEAEVDRMMKLIINSLYKNKEVIIFNLINNWLLISYFFAHFMYSFHCLLVSHSVGLAQNPPFSNLFDAMNVIYL